jgi:Raf kinase inhibitor-like YbhB/YbcL family protein
MTSPLRAPALVLAILCPACASDAPAPLVELPAPKGGQWGPELVVTSDAFDEGGDIPARFTCDGDDASPQLGWSAPPEGTESLAVVVDDPDAFRRVWVHWVGWGISPERMDLYEGIPTEAEVLQQGTNDSGEIGYTGPCPPEGDAAHAYEFHVFAVDHVPELPPETTRDELYRALDERALAMGMLTAFYDR